MNILIAIIAVIAIVLLITGGAVQSLQFLLWVGLVLLALAAIVFWCATSAGRRPSDGPHPGSHGGPVLPEPPRRGVSVKWWLAGPRTALSSEAWAL